MFISQSNGNKQVQLSILIKLKTSIRFSLEKNQKANYIHRVQADFNTKDRTAYFLEYIHISQKIKPCMERIHTYF